MITIDFETKSYADLTKVGAWNYARHKTTEIICAAYGIDDEPIQTWWPGKVLEGVQRWPARMHNHPQYNKMAYDLYCAIEDGDLVEAFNVSFEKSVWYNIIVPRYDWANVRPEQWRDCQAVAQYYALPPKLEKLAHALGLRGKNPEGTRLISKYSKLHLKTAKEVIPQEDFEKFVAYCVDDVALEQDISDFLGDLPEEEEVVFLLDQKINERGIPLDQRTILDAIAIVDERAVELADDFKKLTGGISPTQVAKVVDWLTERGAPVENLQKSYIEDLLEGKGDFTPKGDAKKALEIRSRHAKASTKKLNAMLRHRDSEGLARFQVKYHGAQTGRWTGSGFQPLNLSKGFEDVPPDMLVEAMTHRSPMWLDVMYGDAMDAVGKASRHHIRARPGHRIIAGDFVSIEAVLLSCLAQEEWKIEAFRRGDPLYELMGCKIHDLGEDAVLLAKTNKKAFKEKYPAERFDGKTGELAFGYQGGVGAWRKFDSSDKYTDDHINDNIKKPWREEHPNIVSYWAELERAALNAVANPGEFVPVRDGGGYEVIEHWLAAWLPNGKRIWYFDPQIRLGMPAWHKPQEFEDCAAGTCDCEPRKQLTYMAQKEGQWRRVTTYGGKLTENRVQAASREILIPAMLRLEAAGYPIILSVYDEIVAEVPEGFGSIEEFTELMAMTPGDWGEFLPKGSRYDMNWAAGWPVSVDAWEGERYKK